MSQFPFGMAALLLLIAICCVPVLGWGALVAIGVSIVAAAFILGQLQ